MWRIRELLYKIEDVFRIVLDIGFVLLIAVVSIALGVTYPATLFAIIPCWLCLIWQFFKDVAEGRKKKDKNYHDASYRLTGVQPYESGHLRRIVDEKREYMYTMLRQLNEEKEKLEKLVQSKDSMSQDEFEREFKYQQYIVSQKEQYYHQAVEEYRAAELEAP